MLISVQGFRYVIFLETFFLSGRQKKPIWPSVQKQVGSIIVIQYTFTPMGGIFYSPLQRKNTGFFSFLRSLANGICLLDKWLGTQCLVWGSNLTLAEEPVTHSHMIIFSNLSHSAKICHVGVAGHHSPFAKLQHNWDWSKAMPGGMWKSIVWAC